MGRSARPRRPTARVMVYWGAALLSSGCTAQRVSVSRIPSLRSPSLPASVFWHEPFDALNPDVWREVEVRRDTAYSVTDVDGRRCLEARSHDGASVLLSAVQFDADTYAWLSWEWRVNQPVAGEALERKDGSDAPARLYVYFDTHGLPWQKRSMDYVWSSALPVGTILDSAFSAESKMMVVDGGVEQLGRWRRIERNLQDDYARCFGGKMPNVVAIGIMSDTDNTGADALAYFDDLQVSREPLKAAR